MKLVAQVTKSGIARAMASALVLAVLASSTGVIMADWGPDKGEVIVRVFEGDPANRKMVSGASLHLVADDRSNPDHGLRGTTDSSGTYLFRAYYGTYNLEIRHPDYNGRNYRISVEEGRLRLDASLIPLASPTDPAPQPPEGCLPTPPNGKPLLNIWPISESGADCTDYPLLAARNLTKGGSYVRNTTISASAGDTLRVRLYVHNGTIDYPVNEAKNVMVKAHLPATKDAATITAEAWADNADRITSAQKGGNVAINMAADERLQYIPGSAKVYGQGSALIGAFSDNVVSSSGASLGNMRGCYEYLRFVTFEVKVVKETTPTPPPPPADPKPGAFSLSTSCFNWPDPKIELNWTASANAQTYQIERSVNGGSFSLYSTAFRPDAGGFDFVDSNVSANSTYAYRVKAVGSAGSVYSNTSSKSVTGANCGEVVTVQPTIGLEKTVRNATDGQTIFAKSVAADPGDQVEFQLRIPVTQTVHNITINDVLPSRLTYVSNSLTLDGQPAGNSLASIVVGTATNATRVVKFKATVAPASEFAVVTTTLTNVANLVSSAGSRTDTANVLVNKSDQPQASINLEKVVRNVSDNQVAFTDSVNADFNEQVEFQLRITANGAVSNIVVTDDLPGQLDYVANSLRIDGAAAGNDLNNIVVGSMNGGQKNITFRANVEGSGSFSSGTTTLTNVASLTSSAGSDSDTARVIVTKSGGGGDNPSLDIEKTVRNVSAGGSFRETVEARKNETLEFRIVIENDGSATARDVRLDDNLPNELDYIEDSLRIDGDDSSVDIFDNEEIGDLRAGREFEITFRARVTANITSHKTVTNRATADASNTGSVSDTAKVDLIPVQGGNIDLDLFKRAWNETQQKDATTVTARPGDVITYTLTVRNNGSDSATFTFEDNIADILELADLISFAGANFDANAKVLRWPSQTISGAGVAEKTFTVRVKNPVPTGTDYVMTNFFGNEVRVPVQRPFTAPPTGSASTISFILAALSVGGAFVYRRYKAASRSALA